MFHHLFTTLAARGLTATNCLAKAFTSRRERSLWGGKKEKQEQYKLPLSEGRIMNQGTLSKCPLIHYNILSQKV